jgi:malate dehydrogenase (quinone)
MEREYDVLIVGGGITGSALFYVLSNYTNVRRIALMEKYAEPAMVNSHNDNNSQTLHYGDIETNYSKERARIVNEAAEMVARYVEKNGSHLFNRTYKLVLAVGKPECDLLRERYEEIKDIFPKLRLITKNEIERLEPSIVAERPEGQEIVALCNEDGYAVNLVLHGFSWHTVFAL